MSRARQAVVTPVAWAAVILPPLWILLLISRLAVNVPFEDDWDSVAVATSWRSGVYPLAEFWQQQSEHRTVFLKELIWLVSGLSNFNVVAEMMTGFGFALVTLLVLSSPVPHGLRTAPLAANRRPDVHRVAAAVFAGPVRELVPGDRVTPAPSRQPVHGHARVAADAAGPSAVSTLRGNGVCDGSHVQRGVGRAAVGDRGRCDCRHGRSRRGTGSRAG